MSDTLRAATLFLITTVFNLYLFVLMVRLILAWVNADYFHPATQFVLKCTNFLVKPLKTYIPNYRRLETATLVCILVIAAIKFFFISLLSFGLPNVVGLLILSVTDALKLLLETFFYAIFLQAILSWLQPGSPIARVLDQFNAPIMHPLQRLIPPVGGFDISPIPALIILQLLILVLVKEFIYLGWRVAFA
jgi:YggT family protein